MGPTENLLPRHQLFVLTPRKIRFFLAGIRVLGFRVLNTFHFGDFRFHGFEFLAFAISDFSRVFFLLGG